MFGLLLTLVVALIVFGVLYWAVMKLAGVFGFDARIVVVIQVILVLIFVFWLVTALLPGVHLPAYR